MKKNLIAAVLCGLILTALAGCAEHNTPAEHFPDSNTITVDGLSDTQLSDDISAEPAAPTESSAAGTSTPETQLPTEKEEVKPESSSSPDIQTESPKPSENKPVQTESSKQSTPAPTEPVQPSKTEPPKPAPSEPPMTEQPKPTEPKPTESQKPIYTQADYDRIIREARAYAESYQAKGFTFEWKDSMEFGWDVGYMGTPRIERDGLEGTIRMLKYHIDKIVETSTNPAYGLTSDMMTYKVVQITIDGDIAFAVIYGG